MKSKISFQEESVFESIIKDAETLKNFLWNCDKYDFNSLKYFKLKRLLERLVEENFPCRFVEYYVPENMQLQLLKDLDITVIEKIIEYFNKDIQQDYYLKNKGFETSYIDFSLEKIIDNGYKLPFSIMWQDAFFKKISSTSDGGFSMINLRNNINKILIRQPNIYFEERGKEYVTTLINSYDPDSELFFSYKRLLEDTSFLKEFITRKENYDLFLNEPLREEIKKHIRYEEDESMSISSQKELIQYFKKETKLLLNELIVDSLFQDNIYNVYLNIREMLRFHQLLNPNEQLLSKEEEIFYQRILNMDQKSSNENFKLYNNLKEKNIALFFYTQLRNIKDLSYKKINQDLLQIKDIEDKKDQRLSQKYAHPIYDLRNEDYYMLIRCLKQPHSSTSANKSDSYTLISGKNTNTFAIDVYGDVDTSYYTYGYNHIDKNYILHVLERNSYSRGQENDLEIGTCYVNRILTSEKITNYDENYSEIKIRNERDDNCLQKVYKCPNPSYYIVYEEIEEKDLNEAKRLNIPIFIISKRFIKESPQTISFNDTADMAYGDSKYVPTCDYTYSYSEWGRKNRR